MNKNIKIAQVLEDYTVESGGVRKVVKELNENLIDVNVKSKILTTKSNNEIEAMWFDTNKWGDLWKYSSSFKRYINDMYDYIFHIHGFWMYPQYSTSKYAYANNRKYLFTFHGMLEPFLWLHGRTKKKLYLKIFMERYVKKASALHAITQPEKENLFRLFGNKKIEVIPNSISYTEIEKSNIKRQDDEKYLLFIGRLHPIKGIELLINSFANIKNNDVKLKIVGPNNNYKNVLVNIAEKLGVSERIEFIDFVDGEVKYQLYSNAFAFVAPSYSEVVGMVNLEAGLLGTPVITTYNTGLNLEWAQNGGLLIEPKIEELTETLKQVISWSAAERNDRGELLKKYIKKEYSWEENVFKWINLYENI